MMSKFRSLLSVLSILAIACANDKGPSPEIQFSKGDQPDQRFSLSVLRDNLKSHEISLFDVEYKKDKTYQAFLFNDVLDFAYGDLYKDGSWSSIAFTAIDGYKAVIDMEKFKEPEAYLVFRDNEYNNWEPIPNHGDDTVAPYYLLFTNPDKIPKKGFSWPWSITDINLVVLQDQYALSTPQESAPEEVLAGYKLFMTRCSSCHAISGEGGGIGPDLNKPQNILTYRSEDMVRSFIVESSKFRVGKMPDFKDLSSDQVDILIDYLYYLKDVKLSDS